MDYETNLFVLSIESQKANTVLIQLNPESYRFKLVIGRHNMRPFSLIFMVIQERICISKFYNLKLNTRLNFVKRIKRVFYFFPFFAFIKNTLKCHNLISTRPLYFYSLTYKQKYFYQRYKLI